MASKRRKYEDISAISHAGTKSTDNFLYYDASITNTSATTSKEARFISTGSELVLNNPSEYAVSIIRFSIPTDNIPLLAPLSFAGDGQFTSGSPIITSVRRRTADYDSSKINNGWLINSPDYVPANTVVIAVAINNDGSTIITMSKNAIATSPAPRFLTANGYIVSMATDTGLLMSYGFTPSIPSYTYEEHINTLNTAIYTCFAELKAIDVTNVIPATDAPFLVLDSSNKLNLYGEQDIWNEIYLNAANSPVVSLFVNSSLYRLLKGLLSREVYAPTAPAVFMNQQLRIGDYSSIWHGIGTSLSIYPTVTPHGKPFIGQTVIGSANLELGLDNAPFSFWVGQNVVGDGIPGATTIVAIVDRVNFTMSNVATATNNQLSVRVFSAPYPAYISTQATSSLPLWSPVQRLVFSTSMPVSTQITQNLATEESAATAIVTNQYRPVLIDFEPIYGADDFTPYQYFPQGPWRFNDLIGSTDLRTIELQVYWVDTYGRYNLISIPPNDKCTIFLAFIKKQFIQY